MKKETQRLFGLIGYPLGHSFSAHYFAEKFKREGIANADYRLFPLKSLDELRDLWAGHPTLCGLNVTLPYKKAILPYLSGLTPCAAAIGAVNCLRRQADGTWYGANTDAVGFELALLEVLPLERLQQMRALVLGNGGSAAAVCYVLRKLGMNYQVVSRSNRNGTISYPAANAVIATAADLLIVQTTPVGMAPHTHALPPVNPELFGPRHFVFDLIYNPDQSLLLRCAQARGAGTSNGLRMLHLQAEYAWQFWNEPA